MSIVNEAHSGLWMDHNRRFLNSKQVLCCDSVSLLISVRYRASSTCNPLWVDGSERCSCREPDITFLRSQKAF